MSLVRDLVVLPETLSKGDYVQSLTAGVHDAAQTLETYAVTPELVAAFRRALSLIHAAVRSGHSQPVYLDGSFGAGKSHFMAVLDLILTAPDLVWSTRPELHGVIDGHQWVRDTKLLQVPVHMLGTQSFEEKVFGAYLDVVRAAHPEAPLPLLFADAPVFDNAASLRAVMGDALFFQRLNDGVASVPDGFGDIPDAAAWHADRFEAARRTTDPVERSALLTRLVATLLPAYGSGSARFVDVRDGWTELSRHAASLGYHGVVLYLDEMILWLMGMLNQPGRISEEFEKLVLIKEGQDAGRPIPIVAFVARQRRPENLTSGNQVGEERATVFERMSHHDGRFDQVALSDSTLRAIIPHRVTRPRSAAARLELEHGFRRAWLSSDHARVSLAAGTATQADFEAIYPFSPALVDALIALSDQLQRERTAIRILVELLVEHASDLEVGQLVPVGDVFDLIAGGEDAFDRAAQAAFRRARELYLEKLLPEIQKANHTATAALCQRLRPGHPIRIGCSGCPQRACRRDSRLVKTALVAALAPASRPLADLTVRKLVHLNHGLFGSAAEDLQIDVATTRLRALAREVNQLRVEGEGDPTVRVSLESVDIGPILEKAEHWDTRPRRSELLRRLLWDRLGLTEAGPDVSAPYEHHHVPRPGRVQFGNVRTLPEADFQCPPDAWWHVVIDYPFDHPGYTPHDDEERLESVRGRLKQKAAHTLVWLPTFFSDRAMRDLGDLCKLDHLLSGEHLAAALAHIPPDDHARARTDLEALQLQKRSDLEGALAAAYGLADVGPHADLLDGARRPAQHLVALDDGLVPRNPRALHMGTAIRHLAEQVMEHRFSNHPRFQERLTPGKAAAIVDLLDKMHEHPDGIVDVSVSEGKLLTNLASPLELCRGHGDKAERLLRPIDRIERLRQQEGDDSPTVAKVRRWADPDGTRGLPELAADLVAYAWSLAHKRVLTADGEPMGWPSNGKVPADACFAQPDLPSAAAYAAAREHAARVYGVTTPGASVRAQNVLRFAAAVRATASAVKTPVTSTPELLRRLWATFGGPGVPARQRTADALASSVEAGILSGDRALVEALAGHDVSGTSLVAMDKAFQAASTVHTALGGQAWGTLVLLRDVPPESDRHAAATALLAALTTALGADEAQTPLAPAVRKLADDAVNLLRQAAPPPTAGVTWSDGATVPASQALQRLDTLRAALAARLSEVGPGATVTLSVKLSGPRP